MAPRIAQILILILVTSGCAYGYAGKESKRRSEREYKPTVRVVTIKEDPDEPEKKLDEPEPPAVAESPCGRPTFDIFYYTGTSQVTKTVDCAQRSVVDVKRADLPEAGYADAQSSGLPEGSWYLLVDPKGARGDYLNNAELLKLSREFSIEYYGRDAGRDLLVYLYQQDDVQ